MTNYPTSTLRIPALRMPAQSAPVNRTGARTSANGDGSGVEAASWLTDLVKGVQTYGPPVWDIAKNFL